MSALISFFIVAIIVLCLIIIFGNLLRSEHILKNFLLTITFLFLLLTIYLIPGFIVLVAEGADTFRYLLINVNVVQMERLLKICALLTLISFTAYIAVKIKEEE
ncbi:hypothetical protein [Paenibacillus protaetiae]|uniref:Uncharacterized protein n=1 Tax=Paenibacillus protaetiae TaxID=2509456 RepID=A0A4P6EW93_9BACL|nr:hypothetical protein [Paenibacillus protaetiae]QAY67294.1 hypothetical protein ET464_13685 [Paenibacillus protaetiae]